MRTTKTIILGSLVVTLLASTGWAATVDGTVKLGGIFVEEEGDLSAVQETYNIHDGFSVTQIRLNGTLNPRHYFSLNLREVNLDARQGNLLYRVPGVFRLTARFDQHRQVFDADRSLTTDRKDWKMGVQVTPNKYFTFTGDLGYMTREGDRTSFPSGTESALGTQYDYTLLTGRVGAEARKDGRGVAVSYRFSDFTDDISEFKDRQGQLVSARVYTPCILWHRLTHLVRGAYGKRELSNGDLDYTLSRVQYTGVARLFDPLQLRYRFEATRIDNASTELKTDRYQNDVDATYYYRFGQFSAGYGYETNDDDRSLTSYNAWRASTVFRYSPWVRIKLRYAGREKTDEERLTLLKSAEATRFSGDIEVEPIEWMTLGGGYAQRQREYPDIDVEAEGHMARGYGRVHYGEWGSVGGEYTYSLDDYDDLVAGFEAESHVVTGRVDFERVEDLRLSGGLSYVEVQKDLDIQKYFFFLEGAYTVADDYHLEVKYNRYEYDDFILLDRYYTADVVWVNVAYDLHFE